MEGRRKSIRQHFAVGEPGPHSCDATGREYARKLWNGVNGEDWPWAAPGWAGEGGRADA